MVVDVVASVLLIGGALLSLVAAVGLLRFPDVFARMHAATKPATLGLIAVLCGAMLRLSVVAGRHTATGKPLLANDPHGPLTAPASR